MITRKLPHYDFSRLAYLPDDVDNHVFDPVYLLRFQACPDRLDGGLLLTHDCGFSLAVVELEAGELPTSEQRRDNAVTVRDSKGRCRVLEARMRTDHGNWLVGCPLGLVEHPETEHEFAVLYDGVRFAILCDGMVVDREFPEGEAFHVYEFKSRWRVMSKELHGVRMANDLSQIRRSIVEEKLDCSLQYYTPTGYNGWIGDVTLTSYGGLFHIFYLYDRRHHGSRGWKGAHEFWHLVSSDMKDWTDLGPVFELDAQWQSVGTGTPFVYDGKLCLSFGLHTERVKDINDTAHFLFIQELAQNGKTGEFRYEELGRLTPCGASYAISEDGLHFTPSRKLIHYLENPSIFNQEDGSLRLCQQGVWSSDHPGNWTLVDKDFPPSGSRSFSRNSTECPCFFKLGGWEYLMVGFLGFYAREDKPGSEWIDLVERAEDIYDGLCVPMAAPASDGRMVEAGWLDGLGWGSVLVLREIIALGGGRLGSRWLPECLPALKPIRQEAGTVELEASALDVLLEYRVPAKGSLSLELSGRGKTCYFTFDAKECRAQWSDKRDTREMTFREECLAHPEYGNRGHVKHSPHLGGNTALENLPLPDGDITLRLLIHRDPKLASTIADMEIGGRRTLVVQRAELLADRVRIL